MDFWIKMKKIREYFFFKDKRPLFDVNFEGVYNDANFKNRQKGPYFEYGKAESWIRRIKGLEL